MHHLTLDWTTAVSIIEVGLPCVALHCTIIYCTILYLALCYAVLYCAILSVLEQLHMAAWLKEEGGRLFKEADYQAAAARSVRRDRRDLPKDPVFANRSHREGPWVYARMVDDAPASLHRVFVRSVQTLLRCFAPIKQYPSL